MEDSAKDHLKAEILAHLKEIIRLLSLENTKETTKID